MSDDLFVYMWVYRVRPDRADEFRRLYGPDGTWARLFRRAPGYLDTRLYQDRAEADRYVTIDRWESEEAFRSFRESFADEFQSLDDEGGVLTLEEASLGEMRPVD